MDISESVQVLLASKTRVVEAFYARFLTRYPELAHHFEGRDMRIQASIVTMALASVEAYYTHRFPATQRYFSVLGHRHYHDGIRPEDFAKFRDVLLETLAEFHGQDWDQSLHDSWREAIDLATETMLQGYEQTFTF